MHEHQNASAETRDKAMVYPNDASRKVQHRWHRRSLIVKDAVPFIPVWSCLTVTAPVSDRCQCVRD